MKPQQLFVFCAVIEHGGFNRAAKALYLTQPAVSMSVRDLEQSFGRPLIDRKTDPLSPTELGEEVYRLAREMRDPFEALRRLKDMVSDPEHDHLVIGYAAMAEVYLLTSELVIFQATYPQYNLVIQYMGPDKLVPALMNHQADFALLLDPPREASLVPLEEWDDALCVVAPPTRAHGPISPETPLILPPEGPFVTRRMINDIFVAQHGHPPRSFMEVGHPEGLKQAVMATGQPGVLLKRSVRTELEEGQLEQVDLEGFPYNCRHVLCYRRPLRQSPGCLTLARHFRA